MSVKPPDSGYKKNNSTFYQEKTKATKTTLEKQEKKIDVRFGKSNFVHMKDKNIFSEYDMIEKLGEGAYGCVYKVQQKETERDSGKLVKTVIKHKFTTYYIQH